MAFQLFLREEQLNDLKVIRDLGADVIEDIADKLSRLEPHPRRLSELRRTLENILPERLDIANTIMKPLMSLYTLRRQRDIDEKDLLKGILYGITKAKIPWSDKEISRWKELEPQLYKLFSIPAVWTVVKALDLSYDYTNLLQSVKILTDIRPVFNDKASDIEGAIVSHTLRLYFDSLEGSKSLSIALDEKDIEKLNEVCKRALDKAKIAKSFMDTHNKKTFICGEEEEG